MNLLELRQQFIDKTGRADLATTTNSSFDTDDGADFYIRGGIRDLDLELQVAETTSVLELTLAAGEWEKEFRESRFLSAVYLEDSAGKMSKLEHKTLEWMLKYYPLLGDTTADAPYYWAVSTVRTQPSHSLPRNAEYTKLYFMPPSDTEYTLHIYGGFYSDALTANEDVNYWSMHHEQLVVLAALRLYEGFYRNTQGYNDYDLLVSKYLRGIDADEAMEELIDGYVMEG